VKRVPRELQVFREIQEQRVPRARPAYRVIQVLQVQAQLEPQVLKDRLVRVEEIQGLQDLQDLQEQQVLRVRV
jgi:hypothetical protein